MRIAFHSNQLGLRGTEVALFKYAKYNRELLGNESIIVSNAASPMNDAEAVRHFARHFPVHLYRDPREIDSILANTGVDAFYCTKSGGRDGIESQKVPTLVHAVFKEHEPHGTVYAYISEWLSRVMTAGSAPWVPYMVELPEVAGDFREKLGIPSDAIVFGRHGGIETFDLPFVHHAVYDVARSNPGMYFLFLNTAPFCPPLPNIVHARGTPDEAAKVRFLNTCDAMLHARRQGESFGLAVAEFSLKNKPVLTWSGSDETSHLDLLGPLACIYSDEEELRAKLLSFRREPGKSWDAYSSRFSPPEVMRKFDDVFLAPLRRP